MGIRFYCPNGHKLNVKSHLAGRRGICPYCGTKLLIPLKSTRPSTKEENAKKQGIPANSGGNLNAFPVFFDDQEHNVKNATPELQNIDFVAIDGNENDSQNAKAAANQSEIAKSMFEAALDDPNAVWYVQFPDGQRFGPATSPIIKTWIAEKRISPSMLVWREGWKDWAEAGITFPEVNQMFAPKSPPEK
jgi:DNA-directed RNA polymerase subunit RPC12/RpoP